MPFPVAAAIAYGAIVGGGLAGGVAALQRLWRYLNADSRAQEEEDERLTSFVQGIAEALARAKFGVTLNELATEDRRTLENEARRDGPRLRPELNAAAKDRFGKTFSRLNKGEKAELFEWLSNQY
jgi:hypothetical protein